MKYPTNTTLKQNTLLLSLLVVLPSWFALGFILPPPTIGNTAMSSSSSSSSSYSSMTTARKMINPWYFSSSSSLSLLQLSAHRPRRRNNNGDNNDGNRLSDGNDNDDGGNSGGDGIPQLPAIGASSFGSQKMTTSSSTKTTSSSSTAAAFVGSKFELQYTCKICDTRNCHRVSRMAYQNGVVIVVCKGCMNNHLIADNLGWTKHFDGNIEDYLSKTKGDTVNRVNQEVFQLEKVLGIDTSSGSILGKDGNLSME